VVTQIRSIVGAARRVGEFGVDSLDRAAIYRRVEGVLGQHLVAYGRDLVFSRDYISRGMRTGALSIWSPWHSAPGATLIRQGLEAQIDADRRTKPDLALAADDTAS
jgi:hypothetical protein